MARAYDTPIPGYNTKNTIALRLWKSHPTTEFDFSSFNTGDYFKVFNQNIIIGIRRETKSRIYYICLISK